MKANKLPEEIRVPVKPLGRHYCQLGGSVSSANILLFDRWYSRDGSYFLLQTLALNALGLDNAPTMCSIIIIIIYFALEKCNKPYINQSIEVQIREVNEIKSCREKRGAAPIAATPKEPSLMKINSNKTSTSLNNSSSYCTNKPLINRVAVDSLNIGCMIFFATCKCFSTDR